MRYGTRSMLAPDPETQGTRRKSQVVLNGISLAFVLVAVLISTLVVAFPGHIGLGGLR